MRNMGLPACIRLSFIHQHPAAPYEQRSDTCCLNPAPVSISPASQRSRLPLRTITISHLQQVREAAVAVGHMRGGRSPRPSPCLIWPRAPRWRACSSVMTRPSVVRLLLMAHASVSVAPVEPLLALRSLPI